MSNFPKLLVWPLLAMSLFSSSLLAADQEVQTEQKYLSDGLPLDNSILILKEFSSFHFKLHPANAYIPGDNIWSQALEQKIKEDFPIFNVVSKEISETASSHALESSKKLFEKYNPEVVILSLGENDGLYGKAVGDIKMYLSAVIQMAKNNNASVIMIANQLPAHYGQRYILEFKNMYTTLADEYEVPVVAQQQALQAGQPPAFPLFFAPYMNAIWNEQKMVNDRLWPVVKKAIKESA